MGNELGAGNPVGAKRASYTALSITCKFDGEVRSQALHELVRLIVLNPWQSEISRSLGLKKLLILDGAMFTKNYQ